MNWQFPYFPAEARPDWNALEAQFDWLKEMESVPQDPIWHAEGNVLIHTRMVVEALLDSAEYQALDQNDQQIL
ncbi:MAG: poly(A) polymerase, partial [Bacteroidota bacterium]